MEQDRLLEAEVLLAGIQESPDAAVAAKACAEVAQLLTKAEHYDEAAACYRRLAERWPDVDCRDGMTAKDLLAAVAPDGPLGRALAAPRQWPGAHCSVSPTGRETLGLPSHGRLYRLNILSADHLPLPGMQAALNPSNPRIAVKDGMGREISQIPLTRRSGTSFYSSNYALTRGRFYGHLLVLSMGYEVVGIDTLRATRNAEKREIWRYDLTQTLPGVRTRTRQHVRAVPVTNPWRGTHYVPRDQHGNPVGMLGPLSDRGVTFMRGRTLLCVNPIRGDEIWKRNDCVAGSELFGDEEVLVVIAPNANEAQLYRTADGGKIRSANVPPSDRRWTTYGRHILAWNDKPGQMELRLYDPLTETNVWAFDFVSGAKGWIVEGEKVAVFEPSGRFVMINMPDGLREIDTQLEQEDSLDGVYVLASSTHYILVTSAVITEEDPNVRITPVPSGYSSPTVNGRVYAFDRATGKSLWPEPFNLEQFGLPLHQATETPVVTFLRQVRKTVRGQSTKTLTSALCLDKRNGRVLLSEDEIPIQARSYEVIARRDLGEVSLLLPGKTYTLKFSDEPAGGDAPAAEGGDRTERDEPTSRERQPDPPSDANGQDSPTAPAGPREPPPQKPEPESSGGGQPSQPPAPPAPSSSGPDPDGR
jgi:outer membrane protein assembly factor BamB